VGRSLATFIRKRKTGEAAVFAWQLHYAHLNTLFREVAGFEEFMAVMSNNLLRDSIYGIVLRVSVGAALSTIDSVTDIYVITTYYSSTDGQLIGKANALIAMISANMIVQVRVSSFVASHISFSFFFSSNELTISLLFTLSLHTLSSVCVCLGSTKTSRGP